MRFLLSNLLWLGSIPWLCQQQLLTEANAAAAGGLVILFSKQQSYLLGEFTPTLDCTASPWRCLVHAFAPALRCCGSC